MPSSPTETGSQLARSRPMPQMGVSVAEGTIVEWRKRPGDWVEADEPVCDVTTDKIDVEIPSPAAGRLERILVEPGDTVAVGTLLAEINAEARPGEAHPDEHNGKTRSGKRCSGQRAGRGRKGPAVGTAADRSGFYSPVVRRIADKHGVDLAQVSGTGIGGRVRKKDVLAYIEAREGVPAEAPEPALHIESPYRPEEVEAPQPSEAGDEAVPAASAGAPPPTVDELFGPTRTEPMSPMRQAIARHMIGQPAHGGPLHDDRGGGLHPGCGSAVGRARRDAQARRQPHLPGVRGARDGRGAAEAPAAERLGPRRRDRLPRGRQPRDRGRPRRRPGGAGDPPGPAAEPRGHGRRDRRPRAASAGSQRWSPTRSTAAPSRSPTRVSSGRSSPPRSSTSPRWRSWTSRRWSSDPS